VKRKTFVLDASVILHNPHAIDRFPKSNVIIPLAVLEEINKKKKLPHELGKNANTVFRFIDSLKQNADSRLHQGIKTENDTLIRSALDMTPETPPNKALSGQNPTHRTILTAYALQEQGENVVFVSKDFISRVKAESVGVHAENYEETDINFTCVNRPIRSFDTDKHNIDLFFKDHSIPAVSDDLAANEYCILKSHEQSSAVCRYDRKKDALTNLTNFSHDVWGIKPLNVEQRCAMDLLLRDDINLVSLVGPAGTGKTLLALACGLRKTLDENIYRKILVTRPIVPLGQDIGYLPGSKEEKLTPWMQPLQDN
jgi:PhoH-like ATPase